MNPSDINERNQFSIIQSLGQLHLTIINLQNTVTMLQERIAEYETPVQEPE